jgi:hypothetical protein
LTIVPEHNSAISATQERKILGWRNVYPGCLLTGLEPKLTPFRGDARHKVDRAIEDAEPQAKWCEWRS